MQGEPGVDYDEPNLNPLICDICQHKFDRQIKRLLVLLAEKIGRSISTEGAKFLSTDSAANDDMGIALFQLGNHTAIKFFDRAISLNKTDENAFFNRGAFLQSEGHYKDAISSFERALQLNPNDRDAKENLMVAKSQLLSSFYQVSIF